MIQYGMLQSIQYLTKLSSNFYSQVPLAALPVVYRTSEKEPTFWALTDPLTGT